MTYCGCGMRAGCRFNVLRSGERAQPTPLLDWLELRMGAKADSATVGEITELLSRAGSGTPRAMDAVFERLNSELKALARSRIRALPGQTLGATALVNELYLKLIGAGRLNLQNRRHFFSCAAKAMRQILIDAARAASSRKRGGDFVFVTLDDAEAVNAGVELHSLDQALDALGEVQPELLELVQLRYFAGLPMEEIAELSGRSLRSLHRDWACARAFLSLRLAE